MSDLFFSNTPPALVTWQAGDAGEVSLLLGFTKDKKLCRVSFLGKRKASAILKEWKKEWPGVANRRSSQLGKLVGSTI